MGKALDTQWPHHSSFMMHADSLPRQHHGHLIFGVFGMPTCMLPLLTRRSSYFFLGFCSITSACTTGHFGLNYMTLNENSQGLGHLLQQFEATALPYTPFQSSLIRHGILPCQKSFQAQTKLQIIWNRLILLALYFLRDHERCRPCSSITSKKSL